MPAVPAPWDIFCRVIDNHGDLGVCWRLARQLAATGTPVRLWVDEPGALAWMAPQGAAGVQVLHWTDPPAALAAVLTPGPVVIEAFGCQPPEEFIARMAAATPPPVWLNLEYLSAEPYVERSHGLPSPQFSGPGRGLVKWFFYPGFSERTGGLMHGDRAAPDAPSLPPRREWAARLGLRLPEAALAGAERLVLVFGYAGLPWAHWLAAMAAWARQAGAVRLLLPPGPAGPALQAHLASQPLPADVQCQAIPLLAQPDFDTLLAGCDLNLVRGEDSFARAQLASDAPFVWQIYPQHDGAHGPKLEAFLARYLAGAAPSLAAPVARLFRLVNGLDEGAAPHPAPHAVPPAGPHWSALWSPDWAAHQRGWRARQLGQTDLLARLREFVAARQAGPAGQAPASGKPAQPPA